MEDQFSHPVQKIQEEVITWRRYLHQNPEVSFQEEKTSQFVYDQLQSFGNLEVSRPTKTSVVARLIGNTPGKVVALRADMDALPIEEENNFDFVSKNPGVMHACGHDGHTAMLLGAAKVLCQLKNKIKGEVRFIFQHAEELAPGGAQEMVQAGVMEGVDRIIGIHLWVTIPIGEIGIVYGPASASSDTFDITINGKGGHASQPENAIDPIAIGSQVVSNLQHIVSRKIDPLDKVVLSVTKFHGGTAYNVIPDSVTLNGSVRCLNPILRKKIPQIIERIVKGVTDAHETSYEFEYVYGASSIVNDEEVTKKVEETIVHTFGEEALLRMPPIMGSEDFSAFTEKVPGCYIFVGAGNEKKGIVYPHHHPRFTIDEEALDYGVKIYVNAAINLLT